MRTSVKGDPFIELLQQVKLALVKALDRQDVAYQEVVVALVKERDQQSCLVDENSAVRAIITGGRG